MIDNNKAIFEVARVVDVDSDHRGGDMIKARTFNDRTLAVTDIPPAFPLLPKHLYIKPKLGEYVVIMGYNNTHRFFIGPIIPQLDNLEKEDTLFAKSFFEEGILAPRINPKFIKDSEGIYPDPKDLAILGRQNTDIQFKDNELWVRAGSYTDTAQGRKFSLNPTFLKMVNKPNGDEYKNNYNETVPYKTSATLVADEINLISSSSKAKTPFKVNDKEKMVSNIEMKNILEKAHKLPYGDILCEILEQMLTLTLTHTHNGDLKPPSISPETQKEIGVIKDKINNKLLSNNIRIN